MERSDVVVVGAGIVGLATARALVASGVGSIVVVEAEDAVARHQSGRNSGVIHSGLYYKPGSSKAATCIAGRRSLLRYCSERGIPHRQCGKLVVACDAAETERLGDLERRGRANGLTGLRRLGSEEIAEVEPHAAGLAALFVPETGVVDFSCVAQSFAEEIADAGHEVRTGSRVHAVARDGTGLVVCAGDSEITCRLLVNCAGLQADRVARLCGVHPEVRIVPFRGDYYRLRSPHDELVRHLIYPVPDPRLPFLGVHLTRTIGGAVEAGPNAVLALHRQGYSRWAVSAIDGWEALTYRGLWRLAWRYRRQAAAEMARSLRPRAFAAAARRLLPELAADALEPAGCGIRAQAVSPRGELLDDFCVQESERSVHVLNAPSPAATASIAIGLEIARRVRKTMS